MNLPKGIALVIIVVLCSYALLLYSRPVVTPHAEKKMKPVTLTPTPITQATLSFTPSPLILASPPQEVSLILDTGSTLVSEAQVEIRYDPNYVIVTAMQPNNFFPEPLVLLNENNQARGRIFYALSIPVNGEERKGKGTLASFLLMRTLAASESGKTVISFLPKTVLHSATQKSPLPLSTTNLTLMFEKITPPSTPNP